MNDDKTDGKDHHKGFFGPQSVWLGVAVFGALIFGYQALQPKPSPDQPQVATRNVRVGADMQLQELTRPDCLALPDRVWAVYGPAERQSVECIAYAASSKAQGAEAAVVFFQGDIPQKDIAEESQETARANYQRLAERRATEYGVPVVVVGRPGIMGSSGFHINGGQRDEGRTMDAALDRIKERLGIRRLALSGQSGGARIVAQLMILGRTDIVCAAMGAGAYDVPQLQGGGRVMTNIWGNPGDRFLVPMLKANEIVPQPGRRSFVIGDPRDKVAGFPEQKAWADKLASLGHHAQLIEAEGSGPEFHGMSEKAMRAAAMCAQGRSDAEIIAAVTAKN